MSYKLVNLSFSRQPKFTWQNKNTRPEPSLTWVPASPQWYQLNFIGGWRLSNMTLVLWWIFRAVLLELTGVSNCRTTSPFCKLPSWNLLLTAPVLAPNQTEDSWMMGTGGSWAGPQSWWLQLYYSLFSRAVIRCWSHSAGCRGNVMFTAIPIHTQT